LVSICFLCIAAVEKWRAGQATYVGIDLRDLGLCSAGGHVSYWPDGDVRPALGGVRS